MSLYILDVVTLWVFQADPAQDVASLFEFSYTDEGEGQLSRFAAAYRLRWYDTDFAFWDQGAPARELLMSVAESYRTLDEQAGNRLPEGEWNGLYLITGQAGEDWRVPEQRPPMPHGTVEIDSVRFKLVDSFHVLVRP